MANAWRKVVGLGVAASIAACSGSSGSGCGGGLTADYPHDERVANAATVRLTRSGLDFLAANAPALAGGLLGSQGTTTNGVTAFSIPTSTQTGHADIPIPVIGGSTSIDYTVNICPGGPKPTATPPECSAEIDLKTAKFKIDSVAPNSIHLRADVPVRLKDLPLSVTTSLGAGVDGAVGLGTLQGSGCSGTTPTVDYKAFPVDIVLPLVAETHAPRDGYLKVDVDNATVTLAIDQSDIAICASCGSILDTIGACSFLVDQAKAQVFKSFGGQQIGDLLKSQLKSAVCEKPDATKTPSCPAGTTNNGGVCEFAGAPGVCATSLLGTTGHLDTSTLLGNLSNAQGGLDYLFAASGSLNTAPGAAADNTPYDGHTPNGASITMFGGAKSAPASLCVPAFKPVLPQGIPVPDELLTDKLTPWSETTGPNMGVAVSGRFLEYAIDQAYGSGALCIGATTEQFDQLKTGLLSIFVPSIKNLTFEQKGGAMAITARPGVPPRLTLGGGTDVNTDPLIRIALDQFSIDFYVWTMDRFVRIFTFTADMSLPVNLQTGKDPVKNPTGGLLPVLGTLKVSNGVVSNGTLLAEDPTRVAGAFTTLLGGLTSQFTGSIGAVDLSSALSSAGLALDIPAGGIRRLVKDNDAFLGIFANLGVATAAPAGGTQIHILDRIVDKDAMSLTTLRPETRPRLKLALSSASSEAGKPTEWSVAVDRGTRSAWSTEHEWTLQTDDLAFQGHHVLRAWSRVVGHPESEDVVPAEAPFTIDVLAPEIRAVASDASSGKIQVDAFDFVSDASALRGRVRRVFADGKAETFGDWAPLAAIATVDMGAATSMDVEVADEEGNVGHTSIQSIRGRPDPTLAGAASGCGCVTAGSASSRSLSSGALYAMVAAGLLIAVARRRRLVRGSPRPLQGSTPVTAALAVAGIVAVAATVPACSCGSNDDNQVGTLCGTDCRQACGPALATGMIGAYTSVAKNKAGDLIVAGYADADISQGATTIYGDLVVGTWDPAKGQVAWEAVDGVPTRTDGTCPTNDRLGFRGGETDSGDDVGLFTSIAVNAADVPMVAYQDATNRALKFAFKSPDGSGWKMYPVLQKAGSDAGRYAKMVLIDNRPVIVFLVLEPGNAGMLRSRIAVAKASTELPADANGWVIQDLHVEENTPCRPELCAAGTSCFKDTGACLPSLTTCASACGTGTACTTVDGGPACANTRIDPTLQTIPDAFGVSISVAPTNNGLAVIAYDRIHGNLVSFSPDGNEYTMTILDGETGSRSDGTAKDTGDVGLASSFAVASDGRWHVTAVDGTNEAVVHYLVESGSKVLARDIVDDGLTGSGASGGVNPDGKHLIGDDSVTRVEADGSVTICYQDSTGGLLRCASGTTGSDFKTAFTVKTVTQPTERFAGFFPQFVPAAKQLTNHWRALDHAAQNYSGDVSVLSY